MGIRTIDGDRVAEVDISEDWSGIGDGQGGSATACGGIVLWDEGGDI